ncbi:MAG TPA: hypothetical protein VFX12_10900 [Vicinamibacterales bacterium]|nr:hypothetical protein [Vicinamibacterales bacterium]
MLTVCWATALTLLVAAHPPAHLTFNAPPAWHAETPSSSMRVAQFTLPHQPADPEDAQLVVYYFGGQGGSTQANLDRWIGQMRQPDGRSSSAAAHIDKGTVNGLTLAIVDVSGTYTAEMSPGSADHYHKPDFRLIAAVLDTPAGPYFIKLTGPQKTVAAAEPAFRSFLQSIRYQP